MAKVKDYYQVLGVPQRCHARVIEETYWSRAHQLHNVPTRKAQQRLSALNEAYETLASPHRRAEYDRRLTTQLRKSEGPVRASIFQSFVSLLGKPFRPD